MQASIPVHYLKVVSLNSLVPDYYTRSGRDTDFSKELSTSANVDLTTISTENLEIWKKMATKDYASKALKDSTLYGKLNACIKFKTGGDDPTVASLELLPDAIENYVKNSSKRKWLYHQAGDGVYTPMLVWNVEYHRGQRDSEAHVTLVLSFFFQQGKKGGRRSLQRERLFLSQRSRQLLS